MFARTQRRAEDARRATRKTGSRRERTGTVIRGHKKAGTLPGFFIS